MSLDYAIRIKSKYPQCQLTYLGYEEDKSITKNEYTQRIRKAKLESLIDNKAYNESDIIEEGTAICDDSIPSIGLKVYQKNVTMNSYASVNPERHKYVSWIQALESKGLYNSHNYRQTHGTVLDLKIGNYNQTWENAESIARRIMSKTISAGNYIAYAGRVGPGNVAFIGLNVLQYLVNSSVFMSNVNMKATNNRKILGNMGGIECVVCPEINQDTILVFRSPAKQNVNEQSLVLVEADWDDNRWEVVDSSNARCVYCISFTVS